MRGEVSDHLTIILVLLATTLLLSVTAAPFITIRMRASQPGLLADAEESQALLGLLRSARETFLKESHERRELNRAHRLLADNHGINVGAYLTPQQIEILWPFLIARIKTLLAQRVDKTTYADANSVQDEQFELYLYRRFTVRMRKKGLVPFAKRDRQD